MDFTGSTQFAHWQSSESNVIGPTGAYDRYRERFNQFADDSFNTMVIGWAASHWQNWDASQNWQRKYARFDPDGRPYATLLLQQPSRSANICLVEAYERQPQPKSSETLECSHPSLGFLQLRRFPDDTKLTTLNRVLGDFDQVEVLRYRPYKRCTFKIELENRGKPIFGKVFADQRGARIDKESRGLWLAAQSGELDFNVAKPIRWDPDTLTLWQATVDGTPLAEKLFSHKGKRIAERIGRATASITGSRLKPDLWFDGRAQINRSQRYVSELANRLPDLGSSLTNLLEELKNIHAQSPQRRLAPLHGAPHAHQWLDAGDELGLVDFDRFCFGDPELDAATFVTEMDFEDRAKVPVDELNGIFLDAYQTIAGKLDTALLRAYRGHKRLAKALKAARSLSVSGEGKAWRHLDFAWQALRD